MNPIINASRFAKKTLLSSGLLATATFASATAPVISNPSYSPNPLPIVGGQVSVSVKVTSANPLKSVTLYETQPGHAPNDGYGTQRSVTLIAGGDKVTYSGSVALDFNTSNSKVGETIFVEATDTSSNSTDLIISTQRYSNTPPVLAGIVCNPNPLPAKGGSASVSVQATDPALGISSVVLYETQPGHAPNDGYGTQRTAPMGVSSDGKTYTASIPVDLNSNNGASGETLFIVATDPAGNSSYAPVATQGYSNSAPVISKVNATPSPIAVAGGDTKVVASVVDNALPLRSVVLYETQPGHAPNDGYGTQRTAPMAVASDGVTYSATIPVDRNTNNGTTGESLFIVARDMAGNEAIYVVGTQGYTNVPPGGSVPIIFSADPTQPALMPSVVTTPTADQKIFINGKNFPAGAQVLFNGYLLAATRISSKQVSFVVPLSLIASAGAYSVTVVDSTIQTTSNSATLTIH